MSGHRARAVLTAGLLISLAWLYGSVLTALVREWVSNPDASYGVLLAALAVGVAWKRRAILISASTAYSGWLAGFCVLALGLATYLAGMLAPDVYLQRVSFVMVLAGMTWFLTGPRSLQAIVAPLIFLLIAV